MVDPLSALRDKKKDEAKATEPVPKSKQSSPTDTALLDVMGTLGGARRNAGPMGKPSTAEAPPKGSLFRSPSNDSDTTSPRITTTAAPPPERVIGSGFESAPLKPSPGPAASEAGGASFDDMLDAEKVVVVARKCFLRVSNPFCEVQGRILCTNYRMKFQSVKGSMREELKWMTESRYFDIPLGTIEEVKIDTKTSNTGALEIQMKVSCKDLRLLHFLMSTEEDCREVLGVVQSLGQPGNPTLLFAVKHCEMFSKRYAQDPNWTMYDPVQDYARMGVDNDIIPNSVCPWKVSSLNNSYGLCNTYPSVLVLPKRMPDKDIRAVAGFRKRGRLPSLSWCGGHELNYASVWRCSQTTEGLMGTKCKEDENHVQAIRQGSKSVSDRDLLVVDLRPWKAAWANKAGGGGFEGYDRCNLVFGGIDNIHFVRDAWRAMGAAVDKVIDGEVGSWMKDVANSCWYDYIGAIMRCAQMVLMEILTHRANVMVHCSDGWDRTAQTTSLSMLCIDAHYRTQAGFLQLIQKEWCSFGHKFRTRLALGEATTSEYSPIFIQWLEAVYQVYIQYSSAFEFSPDVFLHLATEATSNRFGTFLTDCERERNQSVASHTLSLWSWLLSDASSWRNPNYQKRTKPIVPSVSQASFDVWEAYWFRYHPRGQSLRSVASSISIAPSAPSNAAVATGPLASASPLQPISSSGPPAEDHLQERAPMPADPLAATQTSPPAATKSLFSEEEIAAPKAKPAPKQYFQDDDDDDEDVFSKKK